MSDETIRITTLEPEQAEAWDGYVNNHPDGTFFHLSGWKRVLEKGVGHPAYFFCALKGDQIVGVLPTGHVKSMLFGNSLISSPFSVYGGPIADTEEIEQQLTQAACELAKRLKVDCLEMRLREKINPDWPTKDLYVTFRKEIDPDPDVNMKAIPRKQRAMVRKGIQAGLVSEIDTTLERFYEAYSFSVWRLGTPVFPKGYFQALKDVFGESCEIITITTESGELVASVMNFYFKDEVLPYYGGGLDIARDCKGNDFMYWEVMRMAAERGIRVFDYGRSKLETGSYRFKKHWGFEPEPLPYQYFLVKADEVPQINPNNPKYKLFIDTWKKMPVGLSRIIGPWLAKNLG